MTALVLLLAFGAGREAAAGCQPTWGVRLSTPQIVSASAGVLIGQLDPPQPPPPGTHLPSGFLLQLEPGLGGGKLSAGYGIGLLPYAAAGLKLSALRTWGHPLFAKPNQTYLGIEAEATFFVKLSLGVMRRVRGDNSTARVIVTGGIGLGF
jgi:hypothetical protein